jgi:surfeit locus 1 family protein
MPRRRLYTLLAASTIGVLLLIGLGVWQLERLEWKRALLADLARAVSSQTPALDLTEAEAAAARDPSLDFLRVTLRGTFDHGGERYLFSTRGGEPGWQVITPLETTGRRLVLVDRGFVPDAYKDPRKRPGSLVPGTVEITGLLRKRQEQGAFTPDNQPEQNIWYWPDLPALLASLDGAAAHVQEPFLIQLLPAPGQPALPRPVPPDPAAIPNNHFGYALTWFALAFILAVMTVLLIRRDSMQIGRA